MAQLPLNLWFNPIPTEYVRIIARPRRNLAIEAANEVFAAPHLNPRIVSLYVATPETHQVTVYKTPDPLMLGVQVAQYDSMPAYYNSVFLEDLVLVVGRNTKVDPSDPDVIIDPIAGSTEVEIPFLEGKKIARIYRSSVARHMAEGEFSLTTSTSYPGIRLLIPGDTFYAGDLGGEIIRIEFAPYYENNTGQAIYDLTQMIIGHTSDLDNPHQVTAEQVGLGNLPNAITDSYQENDSGKLATAKSVYELWQASNNSKIIAIRSVFPGNIGAVVVGGDITAVENAAGVESRITVTHNLNIIGSYTVFPMVMGRSTGSSGGFPNWSNDNETMVVVGDAFTPNTFQLFFRKLGNTITSITCFYLIVKT